MSNLYIPVPLFKAEKFWAIQLSDSEHRTWENKEGISKLVFNWEEIAVAGNSSKEDIAIAVTRKYSNENTKKIKNITNGIFDFSRLSEGEGILGVDGEYSVKKTGCIIENKSQTYKTEIVVRWIDEIEAKNAKTNIFNSGLEIQKVTQSILNKIGLPIALSNHYYTISNEPKREKEIFKPKDFIPLSEEKYDLTEKEDKGGRISVFFGTNRNRTQSTKANEYYGDELSDLKFGVCEVSIPRGHVQGEIERPYKFLCIKLSETENKHVILQGTKEMGEQEFYSDLAGSIEQIKEKAALIFIHGYNNTFAEAARRTAQIAWDVPFNGIAGFYSWPSSGKLADYLGDIERADASIPHFEKFIEGLILRTGIEKLHLIAHSMGNRLMTITLKNLSHKPTLSQQLNIIHQVVLAAPDIDQDVFNNSILPQFSSIGNRRTLYSSDKDEALHFSELIRGRRPRLGDGGDDLFVANGIDTIDASNVKSGNNHSYIFDTRELLNDLFFLLHNGLSPIDRRLRARRKKTLPYWLFPK